MADLNCAACEDLKQEVPELVANGFDETMCASLKNDTGLKASSGHNDCTDLDNLNDCLVGNMETEIERYDVCDWKSFMKDFINNVWTTLKAMICAICGLWTNVHNLWNTISSFCITKSENIISLTSNLGVHCSVIDDDTKYDLTINGDVVSLSGSDGSVDSITLPTFEPTMNTLTTDGYVVAGQGHPNEIWATDASGNPAWRAKDIIDGKAFVRYFRDLGAGADVPYWNNVGANSRYVLDIYMDSHGSTSGSVEADRDYVVVIQNCTNYLYFNELHGYVTYYSSGEDDSTTEKRQALRAHKAQHPVIFMPAALRCYDNSTDDNTVGYTKPYFTNYSWTTAGSVLVKAGQHVKVEFFCSDSNVPSGVLSDHSDAPKVRLHQFVLTWIPVSVDAISPS